MHAEQRMRSALVSLCDAAAHHPVRQARRLLAFAKRARRLGSHLMNLGFAATRQGTCRE